MGLSKKCVHCARPMQQGDLETVSICHNPECNPTRHNPRESRRCSHCGQGNKLSLNRVSDKTATLYCSDCNVFLTAPVIASPRTPAKGCVGAVH